MKFTRIINNVAVDTRTETPFGAFTEEIASQFVEVPNEVEDGWSNKTGVWESPILTPIVESAVPQPKLSPIAFKMCFTSQERIAINTLKITDPIIEDAYSLLDDPRLVEVDLSLQSNINLIDYLTAKSVLTIERAVEIKQGKLL